MAVDSENTSKKIKSVHEFPYLLGRVQNADTKETKLVNVLENIKFVGTAGDDETERTVEWKYLPEGKEKGEIELNSGEKKHFIIYSTTIEKISNNISSNKWEYKETRESGINEKGEEIIKEIVEVIINNIKEKTEKYYPHMLTIGAIDNTIVVKDNTNTNITKGKVTFTYTLNKELRFGDNIEMSGLEDKKGTLIDNTGVQHTETYDFELKEDELIYYIPSEDEPSADKYGFKEIEYEEDDDYPVPTIDSKIDANGNPTNDICKKSNIGNVYKVVNGDVVSYKQLRIKSTYIDIKYGDGIVMSDITYKGNDINDGDIFVNDFVFKNPYLDGIEDISIKIIDGDLRGRINIDRSKSAAFERHNILCEVNTMQDLENYRNDFFKIRK